MIFRSNQTIQNAEGESFNVNKRKWTKTPDFDLEETQTICGKHRQPNKNKLQRTLEFDLIPKHISTFSAPLVLEDGNWLFVVTFERFTILQV